MAQKNLIIVESPAKAKTLSKFLGPGYSVKSTFGHIRDLPKKGLGVDKEHGFKPTYEIGIDKQKVVNELKKTARGAVVWLASDGDREGEAIAWHVSQALKLRPQVTKRIVFHEITKPALSAAMDHPRAVDMDLVNAQQARRILDRLVGYELSPMLWKKIQPGLSAGRVQSVAVRLIVEREREIQGFKTKGQFKITADFMAGGHKLPAELKEKLPALKVAEEFLNKANGSTFRVNGIQTKAGKRNPSAPFTTSTLQQEAARQLRFSVKQTMTLAQRLYENGHITYMRTDSTNLSELAISEAERYILKNYGARYSDPKRYKTSVRSAQEAHEAIRPTGFARTVAGADEQQRKLYQLIWRRALASQMSPANLQNTELTIAMSDFQIPFIAKGEILNFDGYLKVWGGAKDDVVLPPIKSGQKLKLLAMTALETFTKPLARYSEATLVKKLEELGIGRPSTYAPTINTVQSRGYVEKKDLEGSLRQVQSITNKSGKISMHTQELLVGADRGKLVPTPLAEMTTDFLMKHFTDIVDYDFTARAESDLDKIADGHLTWQQMIKKFYAGLEPLLARSAKVSRAETVPLRELGTDPATKKPIFARYGRFGPFLQRGEAKPKKDQDTLNKPVFAPMPPSTTLDNVTLEQALPMFKLPRGVGQTEIGEPISADIGRFGPFLKINSEFISIKGRDPMIINETQAREIIKEHRDKKAKQTIRDFGDIRVLKGRYGPYVTNGVKNARVPTGQEPANLSLEQCRELLKNAAGSRKRPRRRSKA